MNEALGASSGGSWYTGFGLLLDGFIDCSRSFFSSGGSFDAGDATPCSVRPETHLEPELRNTDKIPGALVSLYSYSTYAYRTIGTSSGQHYMPAHQR